MATPGKAAGAPVGPTPSLPSLGDLTQLVEQFKLPGIDMGALVDWQRKDIEALAEAYRRLMTASARWSSGATRC